MFAGHAVRPAVGENTAWGQSRVWDMFPEKWEITKGLVRRLGGRHCDGILLHQQPVIGVNALSLPKTLRKVEFELLHFISALPS